MFYLKLPLNIDAQSMDFHSKYPQNCEDHLHSWTKEETNPMQQTQGWEIEDFVNSDFFMSALWKKGN